MAATLEFRLTGGASNADPNASLGGVMSANQLSATALNNLFDNVSPDEASAGDVEYRGIDIYNSGDAQAESVELYIDPETTNANTSLDLGAEAAPHAAGSSEDTIANESTAPAGISFDHYTAGSKLALANIPAGEAIRVWVRRNVQAGATNQANDQATLNVDYA